MMGWRKTVDKVLMEWGRSPDVVEDDGSIRHNLGRSN
jgi:hypothetical protein